MPMSAIFPSSTERRRAAGFTLLEMVVVLAIMALVTGVAAVRVFSLISSWRERAQLESIEQQIVRLPMLARQRGNDIVLPPPTTSTADPATTSSADDVVVAVALAAEPPPLDLPYGWEVHFDQPLRVRGSGLCEGARIELVHGDRRYARMVTPPFCQLVDATKASP
jgi:prepilin-type N-terminal cleavage/methylation domain-containing protein